MSVVGVAVEPDAKKFTQETCQLLIDNINADGWTHIKDVDGVACSYKRNDDSPFVSIKGEGLIHSNINELTTWMSDYHNIRITDPMMMDIRMVEELGPNCHVYHYKGKMPPLVTNRDFVWQEYDGFWKETSPRISMTVVRSVRHDDAPEESGFVRAELIISGYVMREIEDNPNQCLLTYLVHCDPRGWVPAFMVNLIAGDQAMNVVRIKHYFDNKNGTASDDVSNNQQSDDTTGSDVAPPQEGTKKSKKSKNKKKKNKKGGK